MLADPIAERDRLLRYYATLTDEEIEELAQSLDSLTDVAADTLAEEMRRRGLEFAPATIEESAKPVARDLVTVREFRSPMDALVAKSVVESAGIEAFLGGEHLLPENWLGGIKLRVAAKDVETALAVLDRADTDMADSGLAE